MPIVCFLFLFTFFEDNGKAEQSAFFADTMLSLIISDPSTTGFASKHLQFNAFFEQQYLSGQPQFDVGSMIAIYNAGVSYS